MRRMRRGFLLVPYTRGRMADQCEPMPHPPHPPQMEGGKAAQSICAYGKSGAKTGTNLPLIKSRATKERSHARHTGQEWRETPWRR